MVCVFQEMRPYLAVFVYSAILLVHLLFVGFSHSSGAEDIIPPTVISTEPANGATGVSRNLERISFLFSERMKIGSQAIISNWGPYTLSWAPDGTKLDLETISFTISEAMEPSTVSLRRETGPWQPPPGPRIKGPYS